MVELYGKQRLYVYVIGQRNSLGNARRAALVLAHRRIGRIWSILNGDLMPCHSRVGGNPFGVSYCDGSMDSRLRGNDNREGPPSAQQPL